jgi:hypothetical protein
MEKNGYDQSQSGSAECGRHVDALFVKKPEDGGSIESLYKK